MTPEHTGLERLSPTEVYRRNIQKTQQELLGVSGLDYDMRININAVATNSLDAIKYAEQCNTIDSLDSLISAEHLGTLLKTTVKQAIKEKKVPFTAGMQFDKQLRDMMLYARNSMVYELANTCKCRQQP